MGKYSESENHVGHNSGGDVGTGAKRGQRKDTGQAERVGLHARACQASSAWAAEKSASVKGPAGPGAVGSCPPDSHNVWSILAAEVVVAVAVCEIVAGFRRQALRSSLSSSQLSFCE